jgi:hypothetical protein
MGLRRELRDIPDRPVAEMKQCAEEAQEVGEGSSVGMSGLATADSCCPYSSVVGHVPSVVEGW